ncbi:MAG: hypothetical protein WDO17_08115 [Alphaproteobacteria bacterium]
MRAFRLLCALALAGAGAVFIPDIAAAAPAGARMNYRPSPKR